MAGAPEARGVGGRRGGRGSRTLSSAYAKGADLAKIIRTKAQRARFRRAHAVCGALRIRRGEKWGLEWRECKDANRRDFAVTFRS